MSKLELNVSILVLILSLLYSGVSAASSAGTLSMNFARLGTMAKTQSVGNALTAGSGLYACNLNPASIADCPSAEIHLQNLNYAEGTQFNMLYGVFPLGIGNVGVMLGRMDFGEMTRMEQDGSGTVYANGNYSPNASQISMHFGHAFNRLDVGMGINYFTQTIDNFTANGIGLDVGVKYELNSNLTMGVAVNNLTLVKSKFVSDSENLDTVYRAGLMSKPNQDLSLNCDLMMGQDDQRILTAIGGEFNISDVVFIRGGLNNYDDLGVFSIGNMPVNASLGVGLEFQNWMADISYSPIKYFGQGIKIGLGIRLE